MPVTEPRAVIGHRWTDENWFVSTDQGDVAYNEVTDESGVPIYDERTFEAPKIQEGSKLKTGDEAKDDGSPAPEGAEATPERFQRMGLAGRDGGDRPVDLSRRIPPSAAAPSRQEAEPFPHGTYSLTGEPRTWSGRIVSLEEWRRLSDWERHGSTGKLFCGICRAWVAENGECPFPGCWKGGAA